MDLHGRQAHGGDGVADGIAVMGVGTGVDHQAIGPGGRLVDGLDDGPLVIGLDDAQLDAPARGEGSQPLV